MPIIVTEASQAEEMLCSLCLDQAETANLGVASQQIILIAICMW